MLVCLDKDGLVRDFYFPYVGLENHVGKDKVHKIGIWVDGSFSWLSESSWHKSITYTEETLSSKIIAKNQDLGIEIVFTDIVYNEKNIFIRKALVSNLFNSKREVRLFFNQEFQIGETTHAETGYYNPNLQGIVHYKGRRVFLVGGRILDKAPQEWSVGLFGIEGKEGTWKDAEDGVLSKNPIEHGSVDSVIGFSFLLESQTSQEVYYWIVLGETLREVQALQNYVLLKTPEHLIKSTQDFWRAWVNKRNFSFHGLDERLVSFFKRSLLIIRTHCDSRGGILASGDSDNFQYGRDTYSYIWPRDGAFIANSLDKAGYHEISERFYSFCNDIITPDGYVLHKYQPDKSLGSSWHPWIKDGKRQLAIQEDETALILSGLWEHYKASLDLEFIESIYNSLIKNAADFLVRFRDEKTKLPQASYDLWEERFGVSTFTASSVVSGLVAASNFADLLGKEQEGALYRATAEDMKTSIMEYLFNKEAHMFYKGVYIDKGKTIFDETPDASSFFGPFKFKIISSEDPLFDHVYEAYKKALSVPEFGIARYVGDMYFRKDPEYPGNPWFITTLWFIQSQIARASDSSALARVTGELGLLIRFASSAGMLPEQINPKTGEALSVSPLIWSHAEFVSTIMAYMEKAEQLQIAPVCFPLE